MTTETETKHTPGPWQLASRPNKDEMRIAVEAGGRLPDEGSDLNRENDGSFIVVAGKGEDLQRVGTATFKGAAKRGKAFLAEDPVGLANARLIAAAPELLEALRYLMAAQFEASSDSILRIEKARDAIGKATGERP